MTDTRELYAQAMTQTGTIIGAVRPDQLRLPTPCGEWDVRTLMSHMVAVVAKVARLGEGEDVLTAPSFADIGGDWAAAYRAASGRATAAWQDDAKLDAMFTVPWGKVPGRAALGGYAQEILTHGWDLAVATGQPSELDSSLGASTLGLSRKILPVKRDGMPFSDPVSAPEGAGVYAQLAAWLGRTPPSAI
jgi:uncharacterized protein (TIGR03086 family)